MSETWEDKSPENTRNACFLYMLHKLGSPITIGRDDLEAALAFAGSLNMTVDDDRREVRVWIEETATAGRIG